MRHHSSRQPRDSNGQFADELRHVRVTVRLTPGEYRALRQASERTDTSMTRLIASYALQLNGSLDDAGDVYNPDVVEYYRDQRRRKRTTGGDNRS